ncbi:MAG: hypothetical protein IT370_32000 [Deltaproteobacteria bacterium]|nr:hypothetical protein [Deltaproteobacteria bacterium]
MRRLAVAVGLLASLGAGCGTTSRRVVARRELDRVEERSGTCVARELARTRTRTRVEVLGGGALRLDVQVVCDQHYVARTPTEVDLAEPGRGQAAGATLQAAGFLGILGGGAIGLSSFGGMFSGWDDNGNDDPGEPEAESHTGTITAAVGAGLLLTGVVVTGLAGEARRTVRRDGAVSRRVAVETTPATQPFLVRAPVGGSVRVSPDERGSAIVQLPAAVLGASDRDAVAAALAQPWTLVIEGRVERWTPTAIEVQRLLAAEPLARPVTSMTPVAALN